MSSDMSDGNRGEGQRKTNTANQKEILKLSLNYMTVGRKFEYLTPQAPYSQ